MCLRTHARARTHQDLADLVLLLEINVQGRILRDKKLWLLWVWYFLDMDLLGMILMMIKVRMGQVLSVHLVILMAHRLTHVQLPQNHRLLKHSHQHHLKLLRMLRNFGRI